MGINTDSVVDISSGGINYGKIGISKTLNSLNLDEVFDSVYCSASCQTLCAPKQSYNASSAFYEDVTAPLTFVSQEYGRWNYGNQEICYNLTSGADNSDDPLYARIIWLYSESTFYVSITSDNASNYSLVTQLNAQQWDIDASNLSNYNSWGNRPKPSAFTDTGIEFMPYYRLFIYEESDTAHTGSSLQYGRIEPYLIYKFNDKICITSLWFFDSWYSQGLKYVQGDTTNYAQSALFKCYDKSTLFAFETSMAVSSPIKTWGLDSSYDFFGTDYTEDYIMSFYKVNSTEQHYFSIAPQNLDALNTWISRCGFFFKTDKRYKPLISGGYVTGYTDDLTAESDFDNYTGDMQHDVPDTPGPGPGPTPSGGDDMDIMATGATGSSGGFTHFYIMSPQDLIDLLSDFFTRADPGETLSNNLVCSYILGIPSSAFCATEDVPVAIHNSAQGTPFVSQADYAHVTATNNLLVVGNFDVPRMTNTFYDFSPYSTYEVFIPCCGWVALPDTVAGRKIYVEMYIDIASCCVKAGVKISGEGVCAVANGVLGASIPMAVIESGILRGNNIQAGLGIIGGGINTGIGAGNGNALGIGFGVQQILGGLIDCTVAGNTNYTQQKGGTGDITQFAMGHECYLKVTHPELDPVVNDSIFGHSVGYLCNSIGKLETFSGFTVCGNPHVTFSASAEERDEIERLLASGVIL